MSNANATERLRELLDERGVEHGWADEHDDQTWWKDRDGNAYFAKGENCLMYFNLTPEQAIAATLGNDGVERSKNGVSERGTCALPETRVDHGSIEYNGVTEWRKCSACGEEVLAYPAHYCPSCGAEVVE